MSQYLRAAAKKENSVVTFSGNGHNKLLLLGASMETSCRTGCTVSTFSIRSDDGVVAISAIGKEDECHSFLVGVKNGEANLITHFVDFAPNVLGQVYEEGRIEVVFFGKRHYFSQPMPGATYVPDPNLLCRAMIGKASENDLKQKAVEVEDEASELEDARNRITDLMKELGATMDTGVDLAGRLKDRNEKLEKLADIIRKLINSQRWNPFGRKERKEMLTAVSGW